MAAKPVLSGLGLVRGSFGLILMRIVAGILMVLPAMIVAFGAAKDAGQSEFFASAPLPMPLNQFMVLTGKVTGGALGALPAVVVIALILKFWLDAGAMGLFAAQASEGGTVRTWRTIFEKGWSYFWVMLRIAVIPAILIGAAFAAMAVFFASYGKLGTIPDSRTFYETYLLTPALMCAGLALWSWIVGALALHMRAVTVVSERRNTFLAFRRGLGTLFRRPGQATLFYIAVSAVVAVLSALVIMGWRAEDPRGNALTLWIALWFAAMVVQAFAWHWLARSAVLLSVSRQAERAASGP